MIKLNSAYIIQHVAFEDLGSFQSVLEKRKIQMRFFQAGYDDLNIISREPPDLLIILGGPIGVYETPIYPFLQNEIAILQARLQADLPTLGICLGAQLIAKALGANVYFGGKKEIGWSRLNLSHSHSPYFDELHDTPVLHWHGDTFDLPENAVLQASTDLYPNQAFTYKNNTLALQFHPEVDPCAMEKWFIGHACEIAATPHISVPQLRDDTRAHGITLVQKAPAFFSGWLDFIDNS